MGMNQTMDEKTEAIPPKAAKKRGRPLKRIEDVFPENWREIVILGSLEGKFEEQILRDLVTSNGRDYKNISTLWKKLKEREVEFQSLVKKGYLLRKAWWMDAGQKGIKTTFFNTGAWFITMKNCFGWKDKSEVEHALADETLDKFREMKAEDLIERQKNLARSILTVQPVEN